MKHSIWVTATIMVTAIIFSAGYLIVSRDTRADFLEQRAMLVMRDIGHKIMLQAGDSTSRIPPVKRLNESIFEIEFQGRFAFVPDTLVNVVHRAMASGNLPLQYIVNVKECSSGAVIYGYQIGEDSNTIVPCLGRNQPSGCYTIQIAFTETFQGSPMNKVPLLLVTMAVVAVSAFAGRRLFQKNKTTIVENDPNAVSIGYYSFYAGKRELKYGNEAIVLSDKESRLLEIFASGKNHVIARDRLLKEVWEDEGVFVGRSLDVFVSKLRKKLQRDPQVKIVNIHGKGYKLEVNAS
jgi:hypothetical protein